MDGDETMRSGGWLRNGGIVVLKPKAALELVFVFVLAFAVERNLNLDPESEREAMVVAVGFAFDVAFDVSVSHPGGCRCDKPEIIIGEMVLL